MTFTSLAAAELPKSQPIDGVEISPLFRGDSIEQRSIFWHDPLYLQGKGLRIDLPDGKAYSWRGFPSTSLRRGDWKLIEFHEDNTIALDKLKIDAGEQNNVAQSNAKQAAALRSELDKWQAEVKAPILTEPNPECVLN